MAHQQTQLYALVSMTNNDVYYIDKTAYMNLIPLLGRNSEDYVKIIDAKSNKIVTLNLRHISSVVELGGN